MSVQTVILGAVAVQKAMDGIAMAYADAPAALSQLPCFVTVPDTGEREWPRQPNHRLMTHNLIMDLYVQKGGDLAGADRLLKPYLDEIQDAFDQNITLSGSCLTSGVVNYKYGTLSYGGVDYLGIRCTLRALEHQTVIYAG